MQKKSIPYPQNQDISAPRSLKTPGPHRRGVARQRKSGSDMNMSPPDMETGQLANKLVWNEKWMESGSLATIS
jgi:hypothetical protein